MADVKWIKITTDIFDDEKILMIESMPSADSIIVIWFKLLAFAGKQNNDGVFLMSNRIAYTDEMLASIFRREVNTIRLALKVFEQFGMVEIIDNVITIPNWNKHQTLDAYEKKKQRDRLYQQERRAAQRALIGESSDKSSDASSDVVVSDKEEDKELEEDKKKHNNCRETKEITKEETQETQETQEKTEVYKNIIAYLNEKAGTRYKHTTGKTRDCIKARLKEGFTLDDFKAVIDKKCADWLGDEKMDRFLRPETLFGPKFEGYLNEKPRKAGENNGANRNDYSEYADGRYGLLL